MVALTALLLSSSLTIQNPSAAALEAQAAELRGIMQATPRLSLERTDLRIVPPREGWALGMVSWVATDANGLTYLLHRGDRADPVVVLDRDGRVVRSFGKGLYTTPHAIRIDPQGNVWTTDAKTSRAMKFAPEGRILMEISVGGQPADCQGAFCGTTDIAFAPNDNLFIADGYRNARILEYTPEGRKLREWGEAGTGPGQFRLPHSIAIDEEGIVYVADRENGRIQRFDLTGRYLGEWPKYGRTFGLALSPGAVWLATQTRNLPNLSPGWLMKVDRRTGNLAGYVEVTGVHGMAVTSDGELLVGPGPDSARPQHFRQPRR